MHHLAGYFVLATTLSGVMTAFASDERPPLAGLDGIASNEDLDAQAVFSFAIMSDNEGDAGVDRIESRRMEAWLKDADCRFVIGLGDHAKVGRPNPFLTMLREDPWWHNYFYPCIGDGETQFYGSTQNSYGDGVGLFDEVKLADRTNVAMRDTGLEYYAKIPVEGYTVHLIMLHFPDHPKDPDLGFLEDSKEFLVDTLRSINKGPKDIIIAGAHSILGHWVTLLDEERRRIVAEKVDLALAATSHCFRRNVIPGYAEAGVLEINTGSVTNAGGDYRHNGYTQVHVLPDPTRLVVQYINCEWDERRLRQSQFAFLKVMGGEVRRIAFVEPGSDEAEYRPVACLPRPYAADELMQVFGRALAETFDTDVGMAYARRGVQMGRLTRRDLHETVNTDDEIWVFPISVKAVVPVYGIDDPYIATERLRYTIPYDEKVLRIAAPERDAMRAVEAGDVDMADVERTGRRTNEVLAEWFAKSEWGIVLSDESTAGN